MSLVTGTGRPGLRVAQFLKIVAVFGVLGPPIGWALVLMVLLVGSAMKLLSLDVQAFVAGLMVTFALAFFSLAFGYLFGLASAVTAGILLGLLQAFRGQVSWLTVIVVGSVVGLFHQYIEFLSPLRRAYLEMPSFRIGDFPDPSAILLCLPTTIICWSIVRRWRLVEISGAGIPK